MPESVKVFAPASVANVGCGFDIFGFALNGLGDEVTLTRVKTPGVKLVSIESNFGHVPQMAEENTASVAVAAVLKKLGVDFGVEMVLRKGMPLGSGLGSSAASAVAGAFAAANLCEANFSSQELINFALEGEAIACGPLPHADNISASLLGGFVVVRTHGSLDVLSLPLPEDLHYVVVHPAIEVKTSDSRRLLAPEIPLAKAVQQWSNVAGLVAGLFTADYDLISRSLEDVVIEPQRAKLIPGFYAVKNAAFKAGALGCSISGSGPSVFALVRGREQLSTIAQAMKQAFAENDLTATAYYDKIASRGARLV